MRAMSPSEQEKELYYKYEMTKRSPLGVVGEIRPIGRTYMRYAGKLDYSLRYDRRGREKEVNKISPLLTAKDFNIDEVDERIRPQFQIMREAISISRENCYDLDIITAFWRRALEISIYRKSSWENDLTPLMPLFAGAESVSMEGLYFGRVIVLSAIYMFLPEREDAEGK